LGKREGQLRVISEQSSNPGFRLFRQLSGSLSLSRVMTKQRPNPTGEAEFFFWPLWADTTGR
jgi:hypothetical protein